MKILVLGGTADGRHLAEKLSQFGYQVLYSIAGLVRTPTLPCELVVGGFRQFGGLDVFLQERKIDLVINATHPYAAKMSQTATSVCQQLTLPSWRFLRPAWQPKNGDQWLEYADDIELLKALTLFKRPLMSAGQLSESFLAQILSLPHIEQVIWRTAALPAFDIPEGVTWLKAIGPFDVESEQKLLVEHQVDVIVSKNSGGDSTSAKLDAARNLGIKVLIQTRPGIMLSERTFSELPTLLETLQAEFPLSTLSQDRQQQ